MQAPVHETPEVSVTYQELVKRYGPHTAISLLLSIERWADVNRQAEALDEEKRLRNALEKLNRQIFVV